MSAAWIQMLNNGTALWLAAMARACGPGSLGLFLVWAAVRVWPGLSPGTRSWLWRLAYLKLLVALLGPAPLDLPLLPAPASAFVAAPTSHSTVRVRSTGRREPPAVLGAGKRASPAAGRVLFSSSPRLQPAAGLMLLWLLGIGWSGLRTVRELKAIRAGCESGVPLHEPHLFACYRRLCQRAGVRRWPRLVLAMNSLGPQLAGVFNPVILLPEAVRVDCSLPELEMILAHELAHQKRRDLVWSWLPAALRVLLFFYPLLWWVEPEWRLAQEMACDEMAVALTAGSAADYGGLLLRIATLSVSTRRSAAAVGVMESYGSLRRRLLAMKTIGQVPSRVQFGVGVGLLAIGICGVLPWRVTAQMVDSGANNPTGAQKLNRQSEMRLQQLGTALLMYGQDWDGVLPPMKTQSEARKALYPYVRREDAFLQPGTSEAYQPNPSVSGKQVGRYVQFPSRQHGKLDITRWGKAVFVSQVGSPGGGRPVTTYVILPDSEPGHPPMPATSGLRKTPRRSQFLRGRVVVLAPSRTVAFFEPAPAPDGSRTVLFLDGHLARVTAADWPKLRTSSGAP